MKVERSIQNIQLDDAQLLTLVRRAFPDCQRLDDWKILAGGALNTTYKIQIGHATFALRKKSLNLSHIQFWYSTAKPVE